MSTRNQLGTLLLERGLVTEEQLETALEEQRQSRKSLGRVLIDAGIVSEGDLVSTLAARIGLEFVDLLDYSIDPSAVGLISDSLARRFQAVPIGWEDNRLVVAMADPSNVVAIDDIRTITGAEVRTVVATRGAILETIEKHQRMEGNAEDASALAASEMEAEDDLSRVKEVTEDAPIVKLVNLLISQAVADRASDIHIEPTEVDVRVRYRIDGVLHEVMRSPKNIQSGLISRLKIMSDLNIAERRVPQDGRMSGIIAGKAIDLRVPTRPTAYGEKVVVRILDASTALLDLKDLGFLPEALERYETAYRKPYGTILVAGPTGSGKSTTLYATLNAVNDPAKNVITIEDPLEYRMAGINQVQVNAKAGLNFATALRSVLRSDRDILLVGEVRDRETATIAIEAALTGHLVLTTLHTNDAASTPTRLIELGFEPFLAGSALDCIVAQRLARRLCPKCKEPYVPESAELLTLGWDDDRADELPTLYRAVGCPACGRTGFHGRFAIHEVLLVSEEVERLIVDRAHTDDIKKVALAQGMKTLRQTGMAQALAGTTSIEEILAVVA